MTSTNLTSKKHPWVACVTGAAQGIGLANTEHLADDGMQVLAMDRSADSVQIALLNQ